MRLKGNAMKPLTDKEQRMLDYITHEIKTNGYSPTVRDIRSALDIKSTATVHAYLERLEEKGYITKKDGKSRTLRLDEENGSETNAPYARQIPVLGKITAGMPILAIENFEGYVDFTEGRKGEDTLFALKVEGNSMINAGIFNGDTVIVRQQKNAENGEIVVALVDDSATVKTFYKEKGHFRLQPENPDLEPIIVESVTILGKVVASIRYYG